MAGELSLSLEWSLLLSGGPTFLYGQEPSTHLDLAFFPLPCLAQTFQRCCSVGTKQEGFSLEAAASLPWLLPAGLESGQSLQSSSSARG